jgi:hypothetical protein
MTKTTLPRRSLLASLLVLTASSGFLVAAVGARTTLAAELPGTAQPSGAAESLAVPSAAAQSAPAQSPQTQADALPPTHLQPLALGQMGATPWSFSPAWFVLLSLGVPGLTWFGFAWKRALDEDPHRLRRAGLRELRQLLARVRRSDSSPQPLHLHGWCRAAAGTWGVRVSAPTGGQVTRSLHTLTRDGALTSTWRELWSVTERGLYAADPTPPADWLERAASAAAKVEVPKRARWLPNRLAHWLPSMAATASVAMGVALCAGTLLVAGSARADQAAPSSSQDGRKAAVAALHAHWNDWAAHYNVATDQIQEGNWNFAVAHAAAAFLLHPSSAANRDNLRFAIQQAGTMDPTLRRLLYGAWFQQFPTLLSPAGWQHLALAASLTLAAGLSAMVFALYVPHYRRALKSGGRSGVAAGALSFITAVAAFNAYGALNRPTAGILLEGVNLNPSPTELVPEQETSPATAGSVVLPHGSFLDWQQISLGANVSGWVRGNAVMPFYAPSRH